MLFCLMMGAAWPQMPGGRAVQVSHKVQVVGGKRYLVHIVEQGQTVYAIARAYGLREVEAVTKKDVHFLQVGDTVWLPCRGQKLSDGTSAPEASAARVVSESEAPASVSSPAAPQTPQAVVRPRVNANSIVVSLMIPLNLTMADKISTSKFDVEQRGKITYKSFEFIQFYEGLLLGLERLERAGYSVTLNVVDVEGASDLEVEAAFESHHVAQSDLLIAMLTRQPFEKAAALAKKANLFIVNPVADRAEIVQGNPYVFKCMPSDAARAREVVKTLLRYHSNQTAYIIYSKAKAEKPAIEALRSELEKHPEMHSLLVDWNSSAKFFAALKKSPRAAVVSVYEQDKSRNRIFVSQLLNRLSAFKPNCPTLFTFEDWSTLYGDVDFSQLQTLGYHTFYCEWDMADEKQRLFVEQFRELYKTEPSAAYAAKANDIILYFVTGIQQKGTDFFKSPTIVCPDGMTSPLSFSHTDNGDGFENQSARLYRMTDFHFNAIP